MRRIILSLFLLTLFAFRCDKDVDNQYVDLIFTEAETTPTATLADGITINVEFYSPNLCYTFSHFDVKETSPMRYDIYAKATYPRGNPPCAQVVSKTDTTFTIRPTVKGQYVLHFYNLPERSTPFIRDTVQVN